VEVRIPPGSYEGLQIRHPGKGEIGEPAAPPGDLYITLSVTPHQLFKRDGADTFVTIPVPYAIMCLGGDIVVPTVHGEEPLQIPRGTESGKVFVLRNKGVDHIRARGTRGNHQVRITVDIPTKLSEEEEELIRKLASLRKVGVQEKGFWQGLFDKLTS
jgi:molecular chaperone DnaJ